MSYTMQQLINKARIPLNDADKARYPDADLLEYGNDAILILRKKRPDLFFGSFTALPEALAAGATFPLDSEYYPVVADYVTARAETRDADQVVEGRAGAFYKLFVSEAVGG